MNNSKNGNFWKAPGISFASYQIFVHVTPLWKKTEHIDFQFLYALTLPFYFILIDRIDYANCIDLFSDSLTISRDSSVASAISSKTIFPDFIK